MASGEIMFEDGETNDAHLLEALQSKAQRGITCAPATIAVFISTEVSPESDST